MARAILLLFLLTGVACKKQNAPVVAIGSGSGTYHVVFTSYDKDKKISVIKAVRDNTGFGLAEAKALVENPPFTLKKGLAETEARSLAKTLEASGVTVTVAKE